MARTKTTRATPAPGSGTIFALRAIGLVFLARWLFSMSLMGYRASLSAMASSPWACINVVLIFLLLVLPGAQARAERPYHPLPQWLRQALRLFALLGFVFAAWSVGVFAWAAGWRRALHALAVSNGWLLAAPALYAAVIWMCRPRALWRTNVAARRFAIGRYAIALDGVTRTVVVWMESRKVGQYDARELSVRWPEAAGAAGRRGGAQGMSSPAAGAMPVATAESVLIERAAPGDAGASQQGAASDGASGLAGTQASSDARPSVETPVSGAAPIAAAAPSDTPAPNEAPPPASAPRPVSPEPAPAPAASAVSAARPARRGFARPKIELVWDSPAAVGHNRQLVLRTPLATEGDRIAARALDASLKQIA
ncbi:hypothetical protein [Burkholderia singularis]|uniref:Uncharacterized protein n=1 Tax=Burkholderia singularis TaxID=1503053 RepID=A0A238HDX4_9BURK|nr:hypothetical protein [Burkholderia singularis]SMG03117.1 FIG00453615: hypothetical protein [Burkholderia singularis]